MTTTITLPLLTLVLLILTIVALSFGVYYATQYKIIKKLTSNMLYMDDLIDESLRRMWLSVGITLILLIASVVSIL